jgi:hypothetical protein
MRTHKQRKPFDLAAAAQRLDGASFKAVCALHARRALESGDRVLIRERMATLYAIGNDLAVSESNRYSASMSATKLHCHLNPRAGFAMRKKIIRPRVRKVPPNAG